MGLPLTGLSPKDRLKLKRGNMLLHLIVKIAMLCFHKGIPFVIENSSTSLA